MKQILMFILLLYGLLYFTFQPLLYHNSDQINEAIDLAMNEALKKAALQGRFTDEIYEYFFTEVENVHRINRSAFQVTGTETIQRRGEYINFKVVIPTPIRRFEDVLNVNRVQEYYSYDKYIMSEWTPS